MKKEIIFYRKANGDVPVQDFLGDLYKKNRTLFAKVVTKIKLLGKELLGTDDVKYIGDKIYELRVKKSSDIVRIFYFTLEKDRIVLLDAIVKKEQKLKRSVIERIIGYREDFLKRQN